MLPESVTFMKKSTVILDILIGMEIFAIHF